MLETATETTNGPLSPARMEQHKVPTPQGLSPSPAFIGFRRGKEGEREK
jgi:hypothetical protein